MNPRRAFELVYAPQVRGHLKAIERKHCGLVRQEIEAQLQFEPEVETRNRKPLKRAVTFGAEWDIRFGPNNRFRVFYKVDRDTGAVYILAIGVEVRDQLYIGGEEIEL
jgi:mRNA-degrading endonuclease RelE of RelBE toxin-antitoxin system